MLTQAVCEAQADGYLERLGPGGDGVRVFHVPANATVTLTAFLDDREYKAVRLVSDHPKAVTFTVGQPPAGLDPPAQFVVSDYMRTWQAPVTVKQNATGEEPVVAVDGDGRVFYSAVSHGAGLPDAAYSTPFNPGGPFSTGLYRSTDAGRTFTMVAPQIPTAIPTRASDIALSLAPDGSVWWSRTWGYADATIGCTSADHGDSWTCDNLAVPGVTDRMWVAGISKDEGYVQTGEALEQPQWVHSTDGSLTYLPYATQANTGQLGNMVYDPTTKAIWQVTSAGGHQALLRIDGHSPTIPDAVESDVPATYGISWIAARNGTIWTTGEPTTDGGGIGIVAAFTSDGGTSWTSQPVSVLPKTATFSYISAGDHGRVAVVYYGSDRAAPPDSNGGHWSLYAAETNDGAAADATWVETQVVPLVHAGDLCLGTNCDTLDAQDHHARFSGDLIGSAVGPDGAAHLAYIQELGQSDPTPVIGNGHFEDRYLREV